MVEDTRFPPDVQVKKGYSWSQQLGIAIAALVEGGEGELVDWVKDVGFLSPSFQQIADSPILL
jgi:replication fork protection complex subunit Tof1/Swi1